LKPEPFNAKKDLVIVIVPARPEQHHEVVEAELEVLDLVATQCGGGDGVELNSPRVRREGTRSREMKGEVEADRPGSSRSASKSIENRGEGKSARLGGFGSLRAHRGV